MLLCLLPLALAYDPALARNFEGLDWSTWDQGAAAARRRQLPILAMFVDAQCTNCPRYFPAMAHHPEFRAAARNFVLVLLDESDPNFRMPPLADEEYAPRFAFFNSQGKLLPFDSYESAEYKYFYANVDQLAEAMHDVDDYLYDLRTHGWEV